MLLPTQSWWQMCFELVASPSHLSEDLNCHSFIKGGDRKCWIQGFANKGREPFSVPAWLLSPSNLRLAWQPVCNTLNCSVKSYMLYQQTKDTTWVEKGRGHLITWPDFRSFSYGPQDPLWVFILDNWPRNAFEWYSPLYKSLTKDASMELRNSVCFSSVHPFDRESTSRESWEIREMQQS